MEVTVELVEAAKRGDDGALEELIRRSQTEVYTLALRLVGNEEDARDVTQETYIRVLKGLKRFRQESAFSTWLYRITANTAYTYLAKRKRRMAESLDEMAETTEAPPDTSPGPEALAMSGDSRQRLLDALSQLSMSDKAVVVLKDIYDLPHDAIAAELGISVAACKVRLFRARRRLKDALMRTEGGEKEQVV